VARGLRISGLLPAGRGGVKMLYVESSRLNYNPPEFIGLLLLGPSGSHCSGIGKKFTSPDSSPMRSLREEFYCRSRQETKDSKERTIGQ
jgi:hypothetical protein